MECKVQDSLLTLTVGDLTQQIVAGIVNAANSSLMGGGGVDGAIHRAGGPDILEECKEIIKKIGRLPAGEAVITGAGNLPCQYIIHTVGPIWRGGKNDEDSLLKKAYYNSLQLALKNNFKTVAFPSISTGAYGFPIERASRIALSTIYDFLKNNRGLEEVRIVLFHPDDFEVYKTSLLELLNEK